MKVAAVLGVGPGLGGAIAKRFAREGFSVGLMARGRSNLEAVQREIAASGGTSAVFPADASDARSIGDAFANLRSELGPPEVFVYNASSFAMGSILDVTPQQFEAVWKLSCLGAFVAAREVLPHMVEMGRGTILFTGATASMRGSANFAAFAVGKFGLRALAQSIAREMGPKGIHVGHVVVDGQIGHSPKHLSPDAIADCYWELHRQDKSAWTFEVDLRPFGEKF
jgi:NAD(P)-dependent dehydrogenase (short-subunit alcohol dehydrogenase family)